MEIKYNPIIKGKTKLDVYIYVYFYNDMTQLKLFRQFCVVARNVLLSIDFGVAEKIKIKT